MLQRCNTVTRKPRDERGRPAGMSRRRRLLSGSLLGVFLFTLTGCSGLVERVALAPIHIAEAAAVESAKAPYRIAEAGTKAAVHAVLK